MKALISILVGNALLNRNSPYGYRMLGLEMAKDGDPKLYELMQKVCQAKKALDDYVLARAER